MQQWSYFFYDDDRMQYGRKVISSFLFCFRIRLQRGQIVSKSIDDLEGTGEQFFNKQFVKTYARLRIEQFN